MTEANELYIIIEEIEGKSPYKIVFSKGVSSYKKAVMTVKTIGGRRVYQIERFTEKQAFHENIEMDVFKDVVFMLMKEEFMAMNAFTGERDYQVSITKKGKLLVNKTKASNKLIKNEAVSSIYNAGNNRRKNYLLEEGKEIAPLYDMGIFSKEGKVINSMYDKFKQINRFIEMVDDVIGDEKKLNIIDFGCGKSYLTFVVYYYLNEVKGIDATVTGLDLKEDVIRKCNVAAKKYGYDKLHFELGDINGYKTDAPVDMVITLHACDTATDYALFNAINWKARYILSVPCCQHEVNKEISCDALKPLMKYGIIKQRTSELVTDSLRAELLTYMGYKTQLLEFIDIAHSPKNLLIRAVKENISSNKREEALENSRAMCKMFGVEPTLLKLIDSQNKN